MLIKFLFKIKSDKQPFIIESTDYFFTIRRFTSRPPYNHTIEFILFVVKTTVDNVIEQLLQTNNIQKQQSIASWLSPFIEDIQIKQNFNRQEILGLLNLNNYV